MSEILITHDLMATLGQPVINEPLVTKWRLTCRVSSSNEPWASTGANNPSGSEEVKVKLQQCISRTSPARSRGPTDFLLAHLGRASARRWPSKRRSLSPFWRRFLVVRWCSKNALPTGGPRGLEGADYHTHAGCTAGRLASLKRRLLVAEQLDERIRSPMTSCAERWKPALHWESSVHDRRIAVSVVDRVIYP